MLYCRQLKADLLTVLDKFVEQAAMLDKLYVFLINQGTYTNDYYVQ